MSAYARNITVAVLVVFVSLLQGSLFAQETGAPARKTANQVVEQLVMANRILALEGIFDYAGHVSVRNPENPKTFFIARSIAPESVTRADIVEVDVEGNVLSKTMRPYAERIIHARILNARQDINAVVHAHPAALIAFSVSGIPLRPVAHTSARLMEPEGLPVYDEYDFKSPKATGMLVTTRDEGDRLARKLGKSTAVLMRGHGFTAVGADIPELVMTAIALRDNAVVSLLAIQLGGTVKYMSADEAGIKGPSAASVLAGERAWNAYVERVKKAMSDMR
jgi:ribulose-5-phosphate 4-epimerase/fuculose-1-phosphate aldolase